MTVGGVLSMFSAADVVLAVFPALSVAEPLTVSLLPSVETVIGALQLPTPESASEQLKLTTTSVLFQPLPLGEGAADAKIVGNVRSIFRVIVVVALWPMESV